MAIAFTEHFFLMNFSNLESEYENIFLAKGIELLQCPFHALDYH